MVALRNNEIDRFLAAPHELIHLVLFHGPDGGLVSERAERYCAMVASEAGTIRFESDSIAADPGLLADEAYGLGLFSEGRKAIRIRLGGNRPLGPALEPLLRSPPPDAWLAIEAGELRKTAPLRQLCEAARTAAAIGCYPDDENALDRVINEECGTAGLKIEADARAALHRLLGADRLVSRSEIRKLCLYAGDAGSIRVADVRATVGDAGLLAADELADAVGLGDVAGMGRAWRRLLETGAQPSVLVGAVLRHIQHLHRLAAEDEGRSERGSSGRSGYGDRRMFLERQLRLWSLADIESAIARLDSLHGESRLHPALAQAMVSQGLLSLAARARARSGRHAGIAPGG